MNLICSCLASQIFLFRRRAFSLLVVLKASEDALICFTFEQVLVRRNHGVMNVGSAQEASSPRFDPFHDKLPFCGKTALSF